MIENQEILLIPDDYDLDDCFDNFTTEIECYFTVEQVYLVHFYVYKVLFCK